MLSDLILPSRISQVWSESGIDSPEFCHDKTWFYKYPHDVEYHYNSRGFRDAEWPTDPDDLKDAIWCLGDSFTVGLGSPIDHIWPRVLQARTGIRTINISMDGASNDWISRQAKQIQQEIQPYHMVIMWSYLHRRESKNHRLDDESRRMHTDPHGDISTDLENFKSNISSVIDGTSNLSQLIIPQAFPEYTWEKIRGKDWPKDYPDDPETLSEFIKYEIRNKFNCWDSLRDEARLEIKKYHQASIELLETHSIKQVEKLDLARDGHHFDLITSRWVVDQIIADLLPQS